MSAELDRILTDAAREPSSAPDVDALWRRGRRRRAGRSAAIAGGALAVVALAGLSLTTWFDLAPTLDPVGEIPPEDAVREIVATLAPEPGDELADDRAPELGIDDLDELEISGLVAPLATLGPSCNLVERDLPERSVLQLFDPGSTEVQRREFEPACDVWTGSGQDAIVQVWETQEPRHLRTTDGGEATLGSVELAVEPLREPSALVARLDGEDDTPPALLIGGPDTDGRVLLMPREAATSVVSFDLDTGDEETLVDLDGQLPGGVAVVAAHRRGSDLTFVVAESGVLPSFIPGAGQRGTPSELWLQQADDEPRLVRTLSDLEQQPDGSAATIRDIVGPRLLPGPDGPLLVTLERGLDRRDAVDLVLTNAEGDTRIIGRLTDVLTGSIGSPSPTRPGPSLDVVGDQVVIGLPGAGGGPTAGVVVHVDLASGRWSRVPTDDASAAWFVTP